MKGSSSQARRHLFRQSALLIFFLCHHDKSMTFLHHQASVSKVLLVWYGTLSSIATLSSAPALQNYSTFPIQHNHGVSIGCPPLELLYNRPLIGRTKQEVAFKCRMTIHHSWWLITCDCADEWHSCFRIFSQACSPTPIMLDSTGQCLSTCVA